ncbi:MAG: hypothetical protein AB4352_02390 [Hormoscilla sp.]
MNTPSHFLVNAALEKILPRLAIAKSAFLLGSIAPDLPLYILSYSRHDTASLPIDTAYFQVSTLPR